MPRGVLAKAHDQSFIESLADSSQFYLILKISNSF